MSLHSYKIGIRTKLIAIFVLIKVVPLVILAWVAWVALSNLGITVDNRYVAMIAGTHQAVKDVSDLSTQNSIEALDQKSRETIERLTTDTARAVAAFLYDRDTDIELASELLPDKEQYIRFLSARKRSVIFHEPWILDKDGDKWIPERPSETAGTPEISASNDDNSRNFNYRPPEDCGFTKRQPTYLEMTFVDLTGQEKIKVTTSDILPDSLSDVSDPANTYCRAERYFQKLKDLKPGEIYVSEVIGPYVKGHFVGPYTRTRTDKSGIPFAPEQSGYAGKENPQGVRFQGLVRWATPVVKGGRITGYVTLALDHTHIMEFTDHIIPTDERYSAISDAASGNYAFMWDYLGRNISHPRDYFIVGYDPESGEQAVPWLDQEMYALWSQSDKSMKTFVEKAPIFKEQSLSKKAAEPLTSNGFLGLDGRYLNFAPQCTGWHNLTQKGGSGSFLIFWSGLWKLTTAASIPYHTGIYGQHPRGFGYVTIGANAREFHRPAIETGNAIQHIQADFNEKLEKEKKDNRTLISKTLENEFARLTLYTGIMIVLVIGIAVFMAGVLTGRITGIIQGIRRFQDGDMKYRLDSLSNDEMGQLADAYNEMAETVESHIGDLEASRSQLTRHRDNLEEMVKDRTRELEKEIDERKQQSIEKEKLENRLRQIEKMEAIGTLAGGVAHDLNNVLSSLVSYPELLLLKMGPDDSMRKPVETIMKAGKRAAAIVQDLLTLGRKGMTTLSVINLNDVVTDYLASPEHQKIVLFHPRLSLNTELSEDLLNIQGSSVHLIKAMMHLFVNAVESVKDGGEITISTENCYLDRPVKGYQVAQEGDYAALTIVDTGVGISVEDLKSIFEPFYTKKKMGRSGTGLGMAVLWGVVEDHHGYISRESVEGQGSRFTLYIPVTREIIEKTENISLSEHRGHGETILVVDDTKEQREVAIAIFEELGYVVSAVSSGEEAVVYLKNRVVDLIVMDMIMDPGQDGLDTFREVIRLYPNQKVIIASGFSETERLKEVKRLGASSIIKKPYTIEKIGRVIQMVMGEDIDPC